GDVRNAFLAAGRVDVGSVFLGGRAEILGDLFWGPAVGEAGEDFAAEGGVAIQLANFGVVAPRDEVGGGFYFVAVEQAGADVGDVLVPGPRGLGEIGIVNAVAFEAGEMRMADRNVRPTRRMADRNVRPTRRMADRNV